MIQVTSAAAKKIRHLKEEDGASPQARLRVKVKRGGCSGFSYQMAFDEGLGESDRVFTSDGAEVVVDQESMLYLLGLTLDYEGGLNGKGFVFSNPNAKKTCGCGSSFGL